MGVVLVVKVIPGTFPDQDVRGQPVYVLFRVLVPVSQGNSPFRRTFYKEFQFLLIPKVVFLFPVAVVAEKVVHQGTEGTDNHAGFA